MLREIAWRVFAGEYNDSTYEISEGGERSPSYVITPLGARINRLFVVGVITDVENIGTDLEPMWRARLSDPTGVFHVYAGQYQPEASQSLSKTKPPAFAAVMGKSRAYSPEEGTIYVSIRPEMVKTVYAELRDYWILESCRSLKRRLDAMKEALQMDPLTKEELIALGYNENTSEGIVLAVKHYGKVDLQKYSTMLSDALKYLLPEYEESKILEKPTSDKAEEELPVEEELEEKVLKIIESLDKNGKGAPWDEILDKARKEGIKREELEEITNSLLDKGLIYEPVLGRMRRI